MVAVALGSEGDVVSAICTGSGVAVAPVSAAGGNRVKNRRSRGCRSCARRMCCCVVAILDDGVVLGLQLTGRWAVKMVYGTLAMFGSGVLKRMRMRVEPWQLQLRASEQLPPGAPLSIE